MNFRHRSTLPAPLLASLACSLLLAACASRYGVPPEPPLPYRQAEDAFRLGDYDRALRNYRAFLKSAEHEELVPRAYYKMALAEFRSGRYGSCLQVLDEMEKQLSGEHYPQVYALRGDAEEARGNTISAVRWWEMAWAHAEGGQKQKLRERIDESIRRLSKEGLQATAALLTTEEIRAVVHKRLRDVESGKVQPEEPEAAPPGAAPLRRGLGERRTAVPRIAALLPLSGPYAVYGERSLNGIKLALGPAIDRLRVYDTAGEPQVARSALDDLVADPSIVAIVGPLRSEVAEHIAPRVERAGVPMVLLAQREGIGGRWIVQMALTPERQAAAVVDHASGALGVSRYGIIHPTDAYGSALAAAFRSAVAKRGAEVVGALGYSPGAHDFAVEGLSVQKWQREDGLQAVFIPDYAETAIAMATELRRVAPDVILLGSSGWHDPEQIARAAGVLEGAVFVDGFFAGSARPSTRAFVDAYRAVNQSVPGILEAQAYDAAMLVWQAIQNGALARSEVLSQLHAQRTFEGAVGRITTGLQGIQREPFLLRVSGGGVHEIAAAPPSLRPRGVP